MRGVLAVLWLLLISGAALKWAGLGPSSSRIFGAAQISLSSGVVIFGVIAVLINSAWAIAACRVSWPKTLTWLGVLHPDVHTLTVRSLFSKCDVTACLSIDRISAYGSSPKCSGTTPVHTMVACRTALDKLTAACALHAAHDKTQCSMN